MLLKDMVIDKVNRTVTVQNIPVELTGKEFDLLLVLASNKGRVFTKKQLYTQVWTEEYDFDDNNIMAFISKLRKKIEPNPEQPFYIQTVRGVGYRFNKEMDPVHIFPINGDKENAVISRHFSTFTVNLVQAKSSKNKGF